MMKAYVNITGILSHLHISNCAVTNHHPHLLGAIILYVSLEYYLCLSFDQDNMLYGTYKFASF